MKNEIVRYAMCKVSSNVYGLTEGRYYVIVDEYRDIDKPEDSYVYLRNDGGRNVNVNKNRFTDIQQAGIRFVRNLINDKSKNRLVVV